MRGGLVADTAAGGTPVRVRLDRAALRVTRAAWSGSLRRHGYSTMGNYLGKQTRSLRRHERRPSYTHSAAPVLGPRAATPGVAANPGPSVNVSSTCLLLRAMQRADGSSPWS